MDRTITLYEFAKHQQVLRFSCSDLAGIIGMHPYQNIIELFDKYLYQDLDALRELDMRNLDVDLATVEEEVELLLQRLGPEQRQAFRQINEAIKVKTNINDNAKVNKVLSQMTALVRDDKVSQKLSTAELKLLTDEFGGRVRKQYGITAEDDSLNTYETVTGFKVEERNASWLRLQLFCADIADTETDCDTDSESHSLPTSKKIKSSATNASKFANFSSISNTSSTCAVHAITTGPSSTSTSVHQGAKVKSSWSLTRHRYKYKKEQLCSAQDLSSASFWIIGRTDGVSHQIDMTDEDPAQWRPVKVVVELKNRVHRMYDNAPFHEQIQLVSYMIMLGCTQGDLVQCMPNWKAGNSTASTISTNQQNVTMQQSCTLFTYSNCNEKRDKDNGTSLKRSATVRDQEHGLDSKATALKKVAPATLSQESILLRENSYSIYELISHPSLASDDSDATLRQTCSEPVAAAGGAVNDVADSLTPSRSNTAQHASKADTSSNTGTTSTSACTNSVGTDNEMANRLSHFGLLSQDSETNFNNHDCTTLDDRPPAQHCLFSPTQATTSSTTSSTTLNRISLELDTASAVASSTASINAIPSSDQDWSSAPYSSSDSIYHSAASKPQAIRISRVHLNAKPLRHLDNWNRVVLPRLKSFHAAVLKVRRDDALRYSWLLSDAADRLRMVQSVCAYL